MTTDLYRVFISEGLWECVWFGSIYYDKNLVHQGVSVWRESENQVLCVYGKELWTELSSVVKYGAAIMSGVAVEACW
jgi:hypothetical protein